jgi:hypothetical protein
MTTDVTMTDAAETAVLPPGQDGEDVVQLSRDLKAESAEERDPWVHEAENSAMAYTWGTLKANAEGELVLYDIQDAVIAITTVQTQEPPKIDLEPVETGEPGDTYWNGPEEVGLGLGIPPEYVLPFVGPDGALSPPMPMPEEFADVLREQVELGALKDDWLVEVDDKCVADTYQTLLDVKWEESGLQLWFENDVLKNNIAGWSYSLYEFHDDTKRHRVRTLSVSQVFPDPTVDTVEEGTYFCVELNLDATEAKRLYPHLSLQIDEHAKTGQPERPDGHFMGQAIERSFRRKRVTMTIMWLRNQPPPEMGVEGTPEQAPGEGITVDPTQRYTREIIILAGQVVANRLCEHADIPLLHTQCIPVTGTPFGVGEPFRLTSLVDANSTLLSSMVGHSKWFRYPVLGVSEATAKLMPEGYKKAFIEPDATLIFPDELMRQTNGQPIVKVEPPQAPQAFPVLHNILNNKTNQSSGHTNELRGITSNSQQSGKAIELLQGGATSVMSFKARRTMHMVKRLAKLMDHAHATRMSAEDVQQIVSKHKPHITAAIVARRQRMRFDVKVEISSGSQAVKQAKKQDAREDLALGALSLESYCEIAGIDYREEQRKIKRQMREQAQAMAQAAPPGQQQPGDGSGEQPGQSNNGGQPE